MASRRLALICTIILLALLLTSEYLYILLHWRRPEFGYRILLGTLFVLTTCSEIERAFGEGFLQYVSKTSVRVLAVNFVVLESVMFCKRKAFAKKRRVYDEQMLAEDRFAFEA